MQQGGSERNINNSKLILIIFNAVYQELEKKSNEYREKIGWHIKEKGIGEQEYKFFFKYVNIIQGLKQIKKNIKIFEEISMPNINNQNNYSLPELSSHKKIEGKEKKEIINNNIVTSYSAPKLRHAEKKEMKNIYEKDVIKQKSFTHSYSVDKLRSVVKNDIVDKYAKDKIKDKVIVNNYSVGK